MKYSYTISPVASVLLREESTFGDLNFNTSRFVFGGKVGLGLVFAKISAGKLFAEANYYLDITKALEPDPNTILDFKMRHQYFGFSVGLMF